MSRLWTALLLAGVLALLAGCGDEDHRAPTAASQSLAGIEDQPLQGRVVAFSLEGPARFRLLIPPSHGRVSLNPVTGAFQYEPEADFFGADGFTLSLAHLAAGGRGDEVTARQRRADARSHSGPGELRL